MKTDLINTESDLTALTGEWAALYESCPLATPFQSPEWLLPWWRCFAPGRLWVVTLRDHHRLAGLFPFFVYGAPRRLALMGTGISDYTDALLEPGVFVEGSEAVFRFLADHRTEWDTGDFRELRPGSPLLSFSGLPGTHSIAAFSSICPVVKLPAEWKDFHASLSARQRRHLSVTLRDMEERHRICLDRADAENCADVLEDLFRLHASRWNERTLPGVLSNDSVREFHQIAARNLAAKDALGLYRLSLDENVVSVIYGMQGQGRFYSYIGGFDPAFNRLSPGMVGLDFVIKEAIRSGLTEFDFLRGNEPYKYTWGARNRYTYCMTIKAV